MGVKCAYSKGRGFTLIELIAGITIMAVAMTALTAVLFPHAKRSVDPVYQVRAAELGQSLMNEIIGKAFDENTNLNKGIRCGEAGTTCSETLGPELGESVNHYDDVDDYDGYDQNDALLDAGSSYASLYPLFKFAVEVVYDDNLDGLEVSTKRLFKRITVEVTTPGGETFSFVQYKGNY